MQHIELISEVVSIEVGDAALLYEQQVLPAGVREPPKPGRDLSFRSTE